MGQVFLEIEVTNSGDLDRAIEGRIAAPDVRRLTVEDALMDTGATHLCLPASLLAELGLPVARTVVVETATGHSERRIFRNAIVRYEDREAQVEVIELPDGIRPLVGVLPMEALGIEPDVIRHAVRKLPMDANRSYITVLGARLQ